MNANVLQTIKRYQYAGRSMLDGIIAQNQMILKVGARCNDVNNILIKDDKTMNIYDINDATNGLREILVDVHKTISHTALRNDKHVQESGKAFAKALIKYIRTYTNGKLDEAELEF